MPHRNGGAAPPAAPLEFRVAHLEDRVDALELGQREAAGAFASGLAEVRDEIRLLSTGLGIVTERTEATRGEANRATARTSQTEEKLEKHALELGEQRKRQKAFERRLRMIAAAKLGGLMVGAGGASAGLEQLARLVIAAVSGG